MSLLKNIWQAITGQRPKLARVVDQGYGTPVILLHGIGKTNVVWQNVIEELKTDPIRLVALDLLGFGASPKPKLDYTIDDHANAVIASIESLSQKEPAILVGHSMGSLIAVRVARLRPDLVRHLVLYEMPLYSGLPNKASYRLRLAAYSRFYSWVINYQPEFNEQSAKRAQRLAKRIIGFQVDAQTWQPFIKSLENTIIKQTTAEDIKQLRVTMDVIYGSLDMFVIRGKPEKIFGSDSGNISSHTVRAKHIISAKASQLIARRIRASLNSSS